MEDSDSETCRNIRAGGLSDDESAQRKMDAESEEALKAIYYSDEDVLLTPPVEDEFWEETTWMDDKRHGWVCLAKFGPHKTLKLEQAYRELDLHPYNCLPLLKSATKDLEHKIIPFTNDPIVID